MTQRQAPTTQPIGRSRAPRAPRAPKPPKPMTVTQRNTLVTNQLQTALGAEKAAAVTAALEVANEWLASDSAFRQCLRQRYDELAALIPVKAVKELGPVPIPIKGGGIDSYGPYAKYDPYRLVEDYGRDQLRAVLVRATQY